MKCILLVGGEGTRLRPLTYSYPKQMLPIVEVSMIERVLMHLKQYGVDQAVLSLGYKPDAFIEGFPSGVVSGVEVIYAIEPEPLDTAGAIKFAAEFAKIDETFLVVNGDILTDLKVDELVQFHANCGAKATITLVEVEDLSAFGVVVRDSAGAVSQFVEKPPRDLAPSNLINAGTYVIEPEVLDEIASDTRVSIERETFPKLVSSASLYSFVSPDYWIDTGTPEKYIKSHTDLLLGERKGKPNPQAAQIKDNIWTIGDCEILGNVGETSAFGNYSRTLANSFVSSSSIGAGCVVGSGAKVVNSVLLAGAVISEGAQIIDSIVGGNAIIGDKAQIRDCTIVGFGHVVEPNEVLSGRRVPE